MTANRKLFDRDCGLLLHPSSLPNEYGIGDFGPSSIRWIELLSQNKQNLWQILPLNPSGFGDSPYQGLSAFAANPAFISLEDLFERGLITEDELFWSKLNCTESVDFASVYAKKNEITSRASLRFFDLDKNHPLRVRYEAFLRDESDWLESFALFSALKTEWGGVAWTDWPVPYRDCEQQALQEAAVELVDSMDRIRFEQFILQEQWQTVREAARKAGIRIIGDLPIFVAHDSADVWYWRHLFRLNEDGSPSVVAGVPPDYFSETGQLWGNPLYDWEAHRIVGYAWWRKRLKKILAWVDVVRIDHFRGFEAFWEIPGQAETAMNGTWVKAPGYEVFEKFVEDHGMPLPVIAEDLGVITPDVIELRERFQLPGIRIEQFAFGTDPMRHTFLPEAYDKNCVAYTGTHDNDTVVGWFHSKAGKHSTRSQSEIDAEREAALKYFNGDGSEIHKQFIHGLFTSQAGAAIVPAQDVLGLGSEARMNTPGSASGCWGWRLTRFEDIEAGLKDLARLTLSSGRGLQLVAPSSSSML